MLSWCVNGVSTKGNVRAVLYICKTQRAAPLSSPSQETYNVKRQFRERFVAQKAANKQLEVCLKQGPRGRRGDGRPQ